MECFILRFWRKQLRKRGAYSKAYMLGTIPSGPGSSCWDSSSVGIGGANNYERNWKCEVDHNINVCNQPMVEHFLATVEKREQRPKVLLFPATELDIGGWKSPRLRSHNWSRCSLQNFCSITVFSADQLTLDLWPPQADVQRKLKIRRMRRK